jgi:hypothetical protein
MRWIGLLSALVVLDAALTFENVWPTPAVWWRGGLSVELAVCLVALWAVSRRGRAVSKTMTRALGGVWTVLALGRYADVTAPALYGRPINLYWDLRFVPDVIAMVTRVAALWLVVVCVLGAICALALIYALMQRAFARLGAAMASPAERRALAVLAIAFVMGFGAERLKGKDLDASRFRAPVTLTYARQIRLMSLAAAAHPAAGPPMDSDLARVRDADVFVVFLESYGAVSFDRRDIADRLAASRGDFEAVLRETHRAVVSAYVESPTFGGSSWLAHLSLLSGVEVRDPQTNARLMTERRDTLVAAFGRRGFRTIALMPGLRSRWPEGAFYGFDEIYGAPRLGYRGPEFGWFAVPDQFSLERLDALEMNRPSRAPLFVVFPTISTHFPFSPTPPYQPDWARMSTAHPYDSGAIVRAYARQPDWLNFVPGYAESMAYDFAVLGGYLRAHRDHDVVMILLGDHQPPAALSGAGASWDVPVHIVASRPAVLERFVARGFRPGLTPVRPALGPMHTLLPILLDAFGDPAPR